MYWVRPPASSPSYFCNYEEVAQAQRQTQTLRRTDKSLLGGVEYLKETSPLPQMTQVRALASSPFERVAQSRKNAIVLSSGEVLHCVVEHARWSGVRLTSPLPLAVQVRILALSSPSFPITFRLNPSTSKYPREVAHIPTSSCYTPTTVINKPLPRDHTLSTMELKSMELKWQTGSWFPRELHPDNRTIVESLFLKHVNSSSTKGGAHEEILVSPNSIFECCPQEGLGGLFLLPVLLKRLVLRCRNQEINQLRSVFIFEFIPRKVVCLRRFDPCHSFHYHKLVTDGDIAAPSRVDSVPAKEGIATQINQGGPAPSASVRAGLTFPGKRERRRSQLGGSMARNVSAPHAATCQSVGLSGRTPLEDSWCCSIIRKVSRERFPDVGVVGKASCGEASYVEEGTVTRSVAQTSLNGRSDNHKHNPVGPVEKPALANPSPGQALQPGPGAHYSKDATRDGSRYGLVAKVETHGRVFHRTSPRTVMRPSVTPGYKSDTMLGSISEWLSLTDMVRGGMSAQGPSNVSITITHSRTGVQALYSVLIWIRKQRPAFCRKCHKAPRYTAVRSGYTREVRGTFRMASGVTALMLSGVNNKRIRSRIS